MNHKKNPTLSAVILAGGKSSRMGFDKALITINSKPLLSQICDLASQLSHEVYVISPWIEKYQNILPNDCQMIRELYCNTEKYTHKSTTLHSTVNSTEKFLSNGPLIAFAQGLAVIKTEWVLLLACDLALLNHSEVNLWCNQLVDVSPDVMAFLPRGCKGWEPLAGFYRSSCLPLLYDYLVSGGSSFQGWLDQYLVEEISVMDRSVLFNCNTPQDLQVITNQN